MKNSWIRSKSWSPFRDSTPMYRNTPDMTGIGIIARRGVIRTDKPMNTPVKMAVTLCSRIPISFGVSPGPPEAVSITSDWTWLMDSTVAATNQGSPKSELGIGWISLNTTLSVKYFLVSCICLESKCMTRNRDSWDTFHFLGQFLPAYIRSRLTKDSCNSCLVGTKCS